MRWGSRLPRDTQPPLLACFCGEDVSDRLSAARTCVGLCCHPQPPLSPRQVSCPLTGISPRTPCPPRQPLLWSLFLGARLFQAPRVSELMPCPSASDSPPPDAPRRVRVVASGRILFFLVAEEYPLSARTSPSSAAHPSGDTWGVSMCRLL